MNRGQRFFIYTFTTSMSVFTCAYPDALTDQSKKAEEEWVTIYVHGSVGSSMCFKYFFTLFKRDVSDTSYYKLTEQHRSDPKWPRNHAAQGLGLQHIDTDPSHKTAAQLFARLYDTLNCKFFPNQTCIDSYTFGWSGVVNHKQRCEDAAVFYKELKTLAARLKPQHPHLKIRIVAYSHGGNVALNMAHEYNKDPNQGDFVINELILLATPIQRETNCYSLNPFFERIYSIYSRADCVQKIDCFSTKSLFSGRVFCDNSRCDCSKAVQQIELQVTIATDHDLKERHRTRSAKRINRSPGHIELWYFADLCACQYNGVETYEPCFESKLYRTYFPLEPLPAALLAPGLVAIAQNYTPNLGSIVVNVQPDTGTALFREKYTRKHQQKIDFIEPEMFDSMRAQAFPYLQKYR